MHEALELLSELSEPDIDWILTHGLEQQVIANTVIIQEGTHPESLFFVLEGLVGVRVAQLGDRQLRTLGPGELMGEMSFLENRPASATTAAIENSLVLALPRTELANRLAEDAGFAARLYRSFARMASRRLRETVTELGQWLQAEQEGAHTAAESWKGLSASLERFKSTLQEADREAIGHDGVVPSALAARIEAGVLQFCDELNAEIGEASPKDAHVKEDLGSRVQRELLPFVLLTRVAERVYAKPRGYAGDFLTIDWIYDNEPGGTGRLGPVVDRALLNMRAAQAVRNRRGLLAEAIRCRLDQSEGRPLRVVSLACGPARELFDVFARIDDPARLKATLIDIDLQALAMVSDRCDRLKLKRHVELVPANLVYLATGRQHLELADQDLVYSLGLIDYFNDKFVVSLLNFVHDLLRPGGTVILGNFHPRNPDKAMMDHVLDWKLIHRSEEDMNRLYAMSKFGRAATGIRFEDQGINLFAECRRS